MERLDSESNWIGGRWGGEGRKGARWSERKKGARWRDWIAKGIGLEGGGEVR